MMTKKEKLENCRRVYCESGCCRIELTHPDGTRSRISNPAAIGVAMEALKAELVRQIALA